MGDHADYHVQNYSSGQWGTTVTASKTYVNPSKSQLVGRSFAIVKVTGHQTNRIHGTKLIVCDADEDNYYVWASNGVTGIRKNQCTVLEQYLAIGVALMRLGRRAYNSEDI